MKINKKLIKELSDSLEEFNLTQLEYSDGNTTVKVGKGAVSTSLLTSSNVESNEEIAKEDPSLDIVKSPIVGTAYLASQPGEKPFITLGGQVKKGETLLIIEAMKTMNHIQSKIDGVIKEILIQDGEAIEFDQILVKIKS